MCRLAQVLSFKRDFFFVVLILIATYLSVGGIGARDNCMVWFLFLIGLLSWKIKTNVVRVERYSESLVS